MNSTSIKSGYVTDGKRWLVQIADDTKFGFSLHNDDQSWPGGFGAFTGCKWKLVPEKDVPDKVKESLGWILEDAE